MGQQAGEPVLWEACPRGNGVGPALRHWPQALAFLSRLADLGNQGLPPSLTVLADRLINWQIFIHQQDPLSTDISSPWTPATGEGVAGSDISLTVLLKDVAAISSPSYR